MNCCHGPVLHEVRISPSRSGSEDQPPPGSDTQSPDPEPLGAYSNWTAPWCVPLLRMKCVAGSPWVAVHPAMIAPGYWCCRYESNPLPNRLTSSPYWLTEFAATVRVKVPCSTAPSASVAVTTTPL